MKKSFIWVLGIVSLGILLHGCASTKVAETWVNDSYTGGPVSDVLVIGVTNQETIRRTFENKFVQELNAIGVEAVSSADALAIQADQKVEKEDVLKVVEKYGNDAVLITHLVSEDKIKVYHPPRYYGDYYGYYGYAYDFSHQPGYYTTDTIVSLETNLYDVKTEKPIWSGQSRTWNPSSDKKLIDEVIKTVIKSMQENNLLPK